MQYDSIIIGSGLSGLTCGLLLARCGKKVLVLEQDDRPGPVVRGFRRGGVYFDSGFHYAGGLGEGGAFRPLLKYLGLAERLELFPFRPEGFDRLRFKEGSEVLELPVGFDRIAETLAGRFPAVATEIFAYLDEIEQSWCRFPYLDPQMSMNDLGVYAVHGETLAQRLEVFAAFPELQSLLSMHSFLYGIDPNVASTTLNAQVAGSYYHSVHGIRGGGKALIDTYLSLLDSLGVEMRCRAEVTKVLVTDGKVAGVQLDSGEKLTAGEVIATLNPAQLPDLLPDGALRPAYLKRLRNLRQTMSAYILFGKCSQTPGLLERSNLFVQTRPGLFSPGADLPLAQRNLYLTAADSEQQEHGGVIGIVPARFDEVAAYASGHRQRSRGYAAVKRSRMAQVQQLCLQACPELAGLEVLELATPLTLHDYALAPQGAIYGVGRFIGQYNPLPVTRLPGLYLSGQGIAAPGFMGVVVAAYLTCGAILGHDYLCGELTACR